MSTNSRLDIHVRLRGLRRFLTESSRAAVAAGAIGSSYGYGTRQIKSSSLAIYKSIAFIRRQMLGLGAIAGLTGTMLMKGALDFEVQMKRVQAVTSDSVGAQAASYEEMSKAAVDAASVTKFGNQEAAEALYILGSAGLSARESMDALLGTLRLAQATGVSTALAARVQSAAINTFGYAAEDASKVADILTRAVTRSALEMDDIAYSFKYAAGPAASLGVSMEDLTESLMVMSKAGIKGRTAGTTLRFAMIRMIKPTKEAKAGMKAMGLTASDFVTRSGKLKNLSTIYDMIRDKTKDMTKAERDRAIAQLVGANSFSGFLTLINAAPSQFDKAKGALENIGITAAGVGKTMQETTAGSIENFGNRVQAVGIAINERYGTRIQAFFVTMGTRVEKFTDKFPEYADRVEEFLEPFITTGKKAWKAIKVIGADVLPLVGLALIGVREAVKALGVVLEFVAENWDTIKILLIGAGGIIAALKIVEGLKTVIWFTRFGIATLKVTVALFKAGGAIKALSFLFMTNPLTIWIVAIGALIVGFIIMYKRVTWFRRMVDQVIGWIGRHWEILLVILTGGLGAAVLLIIKHWGKIKAGFWTAIKWVQDKWGSFKDFITNPGAWVDAGKTLGKSLINGMIDMINWGIGRINSALTFSVDVGVGPVTKTFSVDPPNIGTIPKLASGGVVREGGRAVVGEQGREVVTLPRGARVDPLPAGAAGVVAFGGGDGAALIHTHVYLDRRQIAEAIHSYATERAARR